MSSGAPGRLDVLGVPVDPLPVAAIVARLVAAAGGAGGETVFYANAHTLALAQVDPPFRRALARASLVFCDGFGVRLAARLLGLPAPPRATPPDWIDELLAALAARRLKVFLVGGDPGVAAAAAATFRSAHPDLIVAGVRHGRFVRDGAANDEVLEAIRASGAGLVLVGLGQPRQELWAQAHRDRLPGAVLAVGALFEWVAGSDRRAPRWASDRGLEWLYRLARHPRRHFRRYVLGLPAVAGAALFRRLAAPAGRASTPSRFLAVAYAFGPSDGGRSGAYRYQRELLAELGRDPDLDLHVFALARDVALLPPGNYRLHAVSNLFAPALAGILWHRLVLALRARLHGARVLHQPYANRRLATVRRPAVLATVLDLAEAELPGRYGRLRRWHAAWLRRKLRRVPCIVAISQATRRAVIAAGADPERVVVVPPGHRPEPLPSREDALALLAARRGLGPIDLVYVSRLEHPGKNHVRLLDALALLRGRGRPLQLVLAGAPWTGAEAIDARLRAHALERQVHALGFVAEDERRALLAAARAAVFPSLVEGFGLPVLEALAAGLPVACADRPPMREDFSGACRFFDPEDPKEIAAAIEEVLDDEALRSRLAARGRELAARFSWPAAARTTAGLYRELADPAAG